MPTFDRIIVTHEQAMTALAIFEDLLTVRDTTPALDAYWDGQGTVSMRQDAIALAAICDEVFAMTPETVKERWVFDWEFVPAFVRLIQWGDRGYDLADRAELVEQLTKECYADTDTLRWGADAPTAPAAL